MEIEHFALNVPAPRAMARWYAEHCDMRIVRGMDEPPFGHFLADAPGDVMIEIYRNEADPIPDYAAQHPLRCHLAFAVEDAAAARDRLLAAGAALVEELHLDDGSHLVMLRDPWGVPIQLCRRGLPLI